MNPNNQPFSSQPQDFSIDYLNQISSSAPKRGPANRMMLVLLGAVLFLVFIIVLAGIFSNGPKSTSAKTTELYMRLTTLRDVSKEQQVSLRNSKLRGYNSSLTLFLTNASSDLSSAMAEDGTDTEKLASDKAFTAEQTALKTELSDKFEEAALNVRLDRAYAIEMAYQLDVVGSLITAIKAKDSDPKMQTFIENNASNFQAISDEFSNFTNS